MEERVYVIHSYKKKIDLIKRIKIAVIDLMYTNDITIGEAAKKVGVSRPTLDNILQFDESNIDCLKIIPYLRTLIKMARSLQVEV